MAERERAKIGSSARNCPVCGHAGLSVMRSQDVRRGRDRFDPRFDRDERVYERCPDCRTRFALDRPAPARSSRLRGVLGVFAALLLTIVVLGELAVLAVLASAVAVWLAVGVVVLVLAVLALVVVRARRRSG